MEGLEKNTNKKEESMEKKQFVSGLEGADATPSQGKTIPEIIDSALANKHKKDSLRQSYASKSTPETRKITHRMLGEKED